MSRALVALPFALFALSAAPAVSLAQQPAPPGQFQPNGAPPSGAPQSAAQPSPWGSMGTGGVAPPPPLGTTPSQGSTPQGSTPQGPGTPGQPTFQQDLDRSKDKDSGRGLSWFWVDAYGGFEHAGLTTFNGSAKELSASGLVKTTGSGGVIGAGIGAELLFVTIGLRGRMGFFNPWQMGRVGPEVGFRFPLGMFEPHFDLGGGYAALSNFDPVVPSQVAIHGGYGRVNAGFDVYPVKVLSLGGEASFDFLGLSRPALTAADVTAARAKIPSITDAQASLLTSKGTGYGATFALVAVVGVHL